MWPESSTEQKAAFRIENFTRLGSALAFAIVRFEALA